MAALIAQSGTTPLSGDTFIRAALPVLDRVRRELSGTPFQIVVSDGRGRLIDAADSVPALPSELIDAAVHGPRDRAHLRTLPNMTVTVASVQDPRSGKSAFVVALASPRESASALTLPYVQLIRCELEHALLDHASFGDDELVTHFLRARRRVRGPLVALSGRRMLTNTAAARLVDDDDRVTLWQRALHATTRHETCPSVVALRRCTVATRFEPIREGDIARGVLVHFVVEPRSTAQRAGTATLGRKRRVGWSSLSAAQLGVAELAADGMTNREISAHLYISRYTVDYHMRQIFAKLDINTRLELVRVVALHRPTAP
jgi:DNA-binding CsgD family transcriptional regulator